MNNLKEQFARLRADVKVVVRRSLTRRPNANPEVQLNVRTHKKSEYFEIAVREDAVAELQIEVLEVKPEERHLVLMTKVGGIKNHFLCGHDERHLFVAQVGPVSTVARAKDDLKPPDIRQKEVGLNVSKRNRRKQQNYVRQGEWFFVPVNVEVDKQLVLKNEPITRPGGGKAHVAQFAFRKGGEDVMIRGALVLTIEEYEKRVGAKPEQRKRNWRRMRRNPELYVKGTIKHADHATVFLDDWHRVFMNTERRTQALGFLD